MSQLRLPPPEVVDAQNQRMRVKVKADAVVIHTVDPNALARDLRGKSVDEARRMLQAVPGLVASPRIDLEPAWAPRAYRVDVTVNAPK